MKQTIITVLLFLFAGSISAQTKFGIATFTTPAGWQANQQQHTMVLDKGQTKGQSCSITIFSTEQAAVNGEAIFLKYLAAKTGAAMRFDKNLKAVKRSEQNGNICYGTKGTAQNADKQATAYFYAVTNGKQTFFIQLISDGDACTNDFKNFWAGLLVDPAAQEEAATSNAKRKKAAPAAVPAAPAPMM